MGLLDLQRPTRREKEEYCYYVPAPLQRDWLSKENKLGEQIAFLSLLEKVILTERCVRCIMCAYMCI